MADELVAEFTNPDSPHVSPDQVRPYFTEFLFGIVWILMLIACCRFWSFHFSLQGANSVGLRAGQQQYDEKNIRRRVYDALNVLMAMNIIFKDKKDIQWKGLPSASLDDGADLKVSVALSISFVAHISTPSLLCCPPFIRI